MENVKCDLVCVVGVFRELNTWKYVLVNPKYGRANTFPQRDSALSCQNDG